MLLVTLALLGLAKPVGAQELKDNSPVLGLGTAQVGQVFSLPPNPGAPFTATVEFETTQVLSDQSAVTHKSTSYVARDSKGRTRNELRVRADSANGPRPETLRVILYNPETKIRTTLSPQTYTATQAIAALPSDSDGVTPAGTASSRANRAAAKKISSAEEVGIDYIDGLEVKHFRERTTGSSGSIETGGEVQAVYEYWYSPVLKVNLISKRSDPRTGTQSTRLKEIRRGQPNASLFEIPPGYKVIPAQKPLKAAP